MKRLGTGISLEYLGSPKVLPPPPKLNVEDSGDQDFLEARVFVRGGQLHSRLLNLVVLDYLAGRPPYRRRIPTVRSASNREIQLVVEGIATRCVQACSSTQTLVWSLLELWLEVLISEVGGGHFTVAMRTIGRRYVDDMIVCEALAVVLDVLHGSLVQ